MQPNRKNKDTIIFDLTGVLFHLDFLGMFRTRGFWPFIRYTLTHWKNPANVCFEVLQKIHKREQPKYPVIYYKGYALPDAISACMHGTISNTEAIRIVSEQLHRLITHKDFVSPYEQKFIPGIITGTIFNAQSLIPHTHPIDQTVRLAERIKQNYNLYALSNMDHETFQALSERYPDLFKLFDGLVISAEVQKIKPYPEIYEHLLSTYQLDPHRCLFIDDQEENITAATKHGNEGIVYKNAKTLEKQLKKQKII